MLDSRNNFIRNYLSVSLMEQHMATLAGIIKEVDKDGLKGQGAQRPLPAAPGLQCWWWRPRVKTPPCCTVQQEVEEGIAHCQICTV